MIWNTRRPKSVLAIDRWSKYVGLAYQTVGNTVVLPVWYLLNDQMIFFNIADLISRYSVSTIVVWRPKRQKDIQAKIQKFINNMNYIIEKWEITIETVDEDYTSVQSWEIVSNFKKNCAEDTISAMLILERRNRKDEAETETDSEENKSDPEETEAL